MKAQIVGMVVDVAKAQASVDSLTATIAGLDQQLADVQAQEKAKGEELAARKAILAERIRTAYDTDRTSLLETVLSSSDFTDVISEVGYQLDFAGQDKALAEQIVADQKVLTVIHQTVVTTRDQTAQLQQAATAAKVGVDRQLKDLAAANAQLLRLEARTEQLLAAQKAAYAKIAANKAKLKANLAAAAKAQKRDRSADPEARPGPARHRAASRRRTRAACSGRCRAASPRSSAAPASAGAAARQLRPLPQGHRHRGPDVHPDPRRRRRQGRSSPARARTTRPGS